jgi:hypothetical protein
MEDAQIVLERHEQRIRAIERDISDLKAVQSEIRMMNPFCICKTSHPVGSRPV